jgi:hypothetical protein
MGARNRSPLTLSRRTRHYLDQPRCQQEWRGWQVPLQAACRSWHPLPSPALSMKLLALQSLEFILDSSDAKPCVRRVLNAGILFTLSLLALALDSTSSTGYARCRDSKFRGSASFARAAFYSRLSVVVSDARRCGDLVSGCDLVRAESRDVRPISSMGRQQLHHRPGAHYPEAIFL